MKKEVSKKDKKVLSLVKDCYNFTSTYYTDRERNYKRYEGRDLDTLSESSKESDSVYVSPIPQKLVDGLATYVAMALLGETNNGRVFTAAPYNNSELEPQAQAATLLTNYYVNQMSLFEEFLMFCYEGGVFGTSILEVSHQTDITKIPNPNSQVRIGFDPENKVLKSYIANEYIDKKTTRPIVNHVPLNNFWVDCHATSVKDLKHACKREIIDFSDIKKFKKTYNLKNLTHAKNKGLPERHTKSKYSVHSKRKRFSDYDLDVIQQHNKTNKDNPKCELITVYKPGTVQFILNGCVVSEELVLYPNVRFPFVIYRNDPKPREFFGRSLIEIIEEDVNFNEHILEAYTTNMLLSINPDFLVDSSRVDQKEVEAYKNRKGGGNIIPIAGATRDTLTEIRVGVPPSQAIDLANKFEQNAKDVVPYNPIMEGTGKAMGSGVRSEGAFELMSRMGSTRLQAMIKLYTKCLEDLGNILLKFCIAFTDPQLAITITGALGDVSRQLIDTKAISPDLKFRVLPSSLSDPQRTTKAQQMLQFANNLAQMDEAGIFRKYKAMAEAAMTAGIFEDPIDLFETDPQVIEAQAQMQAAAAGISESKAVDMPSMGILQSKAQQQQPQQQMQAPNAPQASDVPRPNEGNNGTQLQ